MITGQTVMLSVVKSCCRLHCKCGQSRSGVPRVRVGQFLATLVWGEIEFGATWTTRFYPRFSIELTKSTGYFPKPFSASAGTFASRRTTTKSSFGIEYTVECPYCNKRFKFLPMTRSSMSTRHIFRTSALPLGSSRSGFNPSCGLMECQLVISGRHGPMNGD
jgi:hypothetical protein